jgi:hypothetical protein
VLELVVTERVDDALEGLGVKPALAPLGIPDTLSVT